MLFQYREKRVDGSLSDNYVFKTHIAILDWSEHINGRPVTSTREAVTVGTLAVSVLCKTKHEAQRLCLLDRSVAAQAYALINSPRLDR